MTMAPAGSPEGLRPPGGRPRDDDRPTRKPLPIWDRIKFLILLALIWLILAWSAMASNPLIGFKDAARIELRSGFWVFVLLGLEVLRQLHFLVSEHWAGYHRFWTAKFFGGFERSTHRRLSDWTRFRLVPHPQVGLLDRRDRGGRRQGDALQPGAGAAVPAGVHLARRCRSCSSSCSASSSS